MIQSAGIREEPFQGVRDLERAINEHHSWFKKVNRAFVAGERIEALHSEPDGHFHCSFGQWYYRRAPSAIRKLPSFVGVGNAHQQMHECTRHLLSRIGRGISAGLAEYDTFIDKVFDFNTQVQAMEFEIQEAVCTVDPLTGVGNRKSMLPRLNQERERVVRANHACSISMVDFDRFKQVNDTFGHLAGDQVLRESVAFFARQLRKYDSIFRFGGEEFLICLPYADLEKTASILSRLRSGLESHCIALSNGQDIHVTASFGVASISPSVSLEESIARADEALYAAKGQGRNLVCHWDDREAGRVRCS